MIDCQSFVDRIFDYIDDLLPAEARKSVSKHLNECTQCSNIFENSKLVRQRLRSLQSVKISSDFDTVLRTRISMERSLRHRSLLNRPIRVPIYAAAGALVFIAAFFIFNLPERQLGDQRPLSITSSSQLSPHNSMPARRNPSQVIFPMELLPAEGGASISSAGSESRMSTSSDSIREFVPETGIRAVDSVEF